MPLNDYEYEQLSEMLESAGKTSGDFDYCYAIKTSKVKEVLYTFTKSHIKKSKKKYRAMSKKGDENE